MIFEDYDISKATENDFKEISKLYCALHYRLESSTNYCAWHRNVYPTDALARNAITDGTLFIVREGEKVVGSVLLESKQPEEFIKAHWPSLDFFGEALVVRTLVVLPDCYKQGIASSVMRFAELAARSMGLKNIRCATYIRNYPALRLLEKMGYCGAGEIESDVLGTRKWFKCYEKTI